MTPQTNLRRAKTRWERSRAAKMDATDDLVQTIARSVEEGMPQAEVARVLGWPRQRVSKLLLTK